MYKSQNRRNKMKIRLRTSIPYVIVIGIVLLVAISMIAYCQLTTKNITEEQAPIVIYIPGWKNKGVSQDEHVVLLQKIYPKSRILIKVWESDADFETCKKRADEYAGVLANEISSMSPDEQRNIILIGHSLGGRIAVKALARLGEKKIHIYKGIFLGSAIPDNAPEIKVAINTTLLPCINIYNKNDYVLRYIYTVLGEDLKGGLGAYGYALPFYGTNMLQYEILSPDEKIVTSKDKLKNHRVGQYLKKLAEVENETRIYNSMGHDNFPIFTNFLSWKQIDECCGWKLEKQHVRSIYRIVNAHGAIIFSGAETNAWFYWKHLSTYYRQTDQDVIDRIEVIQDEENPPIKVFPWGWENVDESSGWRLQRKKVLFRGMVYRIIDPKDFQRANGSKDKMDESFSNIKKQLESHL